MTPSIFNDVIGPVMRGPSSSHCAAALRIGRLARDLMDGDFDEVLVEFDRNGSLPTTHATQGSDMGLFGGLLGWDATDQRLPASPQALGQAGVRVRIEIVDSGDPHPNTYRLTLRNGRERHSLIAVSTGGGMIEVVAVDGFAVSLFGDCFATLMWVNGRGCEIVERLRDLVNADEVLLHESPDGRLVVVKGPAFVADEMIAVLREARSISTVRRLAPVLPVLSRKGMQVPFTTGAQMLRYDAGRNTPLWQLAVEYEMARGNLTASDVLAKMVEIVRIVRRSIQQGVAGTHYDDRILGHQSGAFQAQIIAGRLLPAGVLNRAILYVTAMMEVKSSMGVIVAAPTAGACAALPGTCAAVAEELGLSDEKMAEALLAAGLIGVFVAASWTFAAEVGGCQAECGVAACMTAAAMATLADATLAQSLAAASMALQSMLGLTCDPVANRVEVPCLGKNVLAASNAIACANMALAGYDPVIPLDEVIDAARRVGDQLPRELRCTALGGLSITPTSKAIEQSLQTIKPRPAVARPAPRNDSRSS
jgi:L-serine dehydratase